MCRISCFTFDEEKSKFGSNKVAFLNNFWVSKFLTLSSNSWTSSSAQIKLISGYSFNFTFLFGGTFYQMCLTNFFPCAFIKSSAKINNFSAHRQDS